jgi:3'(2'), 5'-bisphosphate nucleotidase
MKITKQLQDQLLTTIDIAMQAALKVYAQDDFGIQTKSDQSPVTAADLEVNRILTETLHEHTPDIPVVSEEDNNLTWEDRQKLDLFWIIDPIDGTKEFIKKSGEFTINLGLIKNQKPIFGVIAIPITGEVFWGGQEMEHCPVGCGQERENCPTTWTGTASYVRKPTLDFEATLGSPPKFSTFQIRAREMQKADHIVTLGSTPEFQTLAYSTLVDITCSKDHLHANDTAFIKNIAKDHYIKLKPCGSTIKICRIAEGEADLYIRTGGINDWDLAAGHAIIEAAGGRVSTLDGKDLVYNTETQKLAPFIVHGATKLDWTKYL